MSPCLKAAATLADAHAVTATAAVNTSNVKVGRCRMTLSNPRRNRLELST